MLWHFTGDDHSGLAFRIDFNKELVTTSPVKTNSPVSELKSLYRGLTAFGEIDKFEVSNLTDHFNHTGLSHYRNGEAGDSGNGKKPTCKTRYKKTDANR
ncbi:hypothetical protein MCOR27_001167 [Pyricularia oryzae]|uniref:Uncharacterized protein n=1 Tax=Pyricularia oryzae TaxID=318829 RepID=A0A4P7NRK2_PYROR|nr:hypothetical protein MCOR01_003484 [Pyricularia oryzae]KAI6278520.1 hypothetical protein MCOR34_011272 [Pyricularia oryzae]KAI6287800.1 hypothetical protein MCOR27_001167 [Pyricularia oryzae]KAI6312036.1 hypothetical protein MCOR29_008119 [Pyricularia oryzae]KAI6335879.1 hypothetical protein MCOR30_003664 [Pyricularia oryzae]